MTTPDTPQSMFIAENGNVTHLGWIAHLYSQIEAYDEASGHVKYTLRVDFVEERARRPILTGTATTDRLAELTIDFFTVIELYRRRLTTDRPLPNLHAVDVRDDKAKTLRALGLDEHSPEVHELTEEMAPKLAKAKEEVRGLVAELESSSASSAT